MTFSFRLYQSVLLAHLTTYSYAVIAHFNQPTLLRYVVQDQSLVHSDQCSKEPCVQ